VRRSTFAAVLAVTVAGLGDSPVVHAQGWSADVSAGHLVYEAVPANVGTSNLIGTLRLDARSGTWVYGSVAVPFDDAGTFWGAAGAGGRVAVPAAQTGMASVGADVAAHTFSFNDRVASQWGTGATLEAIPFVRLAGGAAFVEGRGGWRGQTFSFGARENRGVLELGARGGYGSALRVEGDLHWVRASEGTYPFVGVTVAYSGPRLDVWGEMGKWVAPDLDQRAWAVGSAVSLGVRTAVWVSARQEAPDPLYWNEARRTWAIGLTQRLGPIAAPVAPVPRTLAGSIVVRLSVGDAPDGAVSIAGDFNKWQPAPMEREGEDWVAQLSLAPGVYHYAFRSEGGRWFVPPSVSGRRDDGMGGYVAVLVVN
jgi:hypothetical protein